MIGVLGVSYVAISAIPTIKLPLPGFILSTTGVGFIAMSITVGLLSEILKELKKRNNDHSN
jgi:hypothetical protein